MTQPLSPQEIQELAAGYVLGDLDSDEAAIFQTLLANYPDLRQEVAALQEALAAMPYGLAEVEMNEAGRSQLLARAEAELNPELTTISPALGTNIRQPQPVTLPPTARRRTVALWTVASVTTGLAIAFGVTTLRLSSQMRLLQAQLAPTADQASIIEAWSGFNDLLQDHQKSVTNPDGPADFAVTQPRDIPSRINGFQASVATLPLLPTGTLLGVSNCRFGKTPALRLTYQLPTKQTISAYQLDVTHQSLPPLPAAQMTLQQPNGESLIVWHDDQYLYALVATLPIQELRTLAYAIDGS
jgi:anti-sigma factor RsiW